MKKLLFLLCLLIPSIAFAWGLTSVGGGGADLIIGGMIR
jgi:hypothetical protein